MPASPLKYEGVEKNLLNKAPLLGENTIEISKWLELWRASVYNAEVKSLFPL